MKKIIACLMLVSGITLTTIAQTGSQTSKTQTFEIPPGNIKRKFTVEIGSGNKMQVELAELQDLDRLLNLDSLLHLYLQDIKPLKDSLSDQLITKRIDYLVDPSGKNKIRIQTFPSKGSSFLATNGDIAALKIEQDTICIIGPVPYIAGYNKKTPFYINRFYRVSFFLNQASDLNRYADAALNSKIAALKESEKKQWVRSGAQWKIKDGDESISAGMPDGSLYTSGDQIELTASVNAQNYKNYFSPSFSIAAKLVFPRKTYKYEFGLAWEPNFIFAKNSQGNLQTYRNDFFVLQLARMPIKSFNRNNNDLHVNFLNHLSIGYLFPNAARGDFFDKNTFRIGTGGVDLKGDKIKLEPIFYFHDFFKGFTPGVRLSVNF